MLEQCCPGLAVLLKGMRLSDPVRLPCLYGASESVMYDAFAQLVEFAYTGSADIAPALVAPVWALSSSVGFAKLKVRLCRHSLHPTLVDNLVQLCSPRCAALVPTGTGSCSAGLMHAGRM